jgi:hypothetical protein
MSKKKTKAPKVPKGEIDNFCEEVVLLDDAFEVIMKNVFHAMYILRDISFCRKCYRENK